MRGSCALLCILAFVRSIVCEGQEAPSRGSFFTGKNSFKGELFFDHFRANETKSDLQSSYGGYLDGKVVLTESISQKIRVTARNFRVNELDSSSVKSGINSHLLVHDFYFSHSAEKFTGRFGFIHSIWGKSDAINPTDFFSVKNQTFLTTDPEFQKLGSFGFSFLFDLPQRNLRASIVSALLPGRSTQLQRKNSDYFDGLTTSTPVFQGEMDRITDYKFQQSRISNGIRFDYDGDGWDVDLILYSGINSNSQVQLDSVNPTLGGINVNLKECEEKVKGIGSNFSTSFSDYIFKTEFAYRDIEDSNPERALKKSSRLDGIVGIEKPFGDETRFQFQYVLKHFKNHESNDELSTINSQLSSYLRKVNQLQADANDLVLRGATIRLAYTPSDLLGFGGEVFLTRYFRAQIESFTQIKLTYGFQNSSKLTLGLQEFAGSDSFRFGRSQFLNSVFVDFRYFL